MDHYAALLAIAAGVDGRPRRSCASSPSVAATTIATPTASPPPRGRATAIRPAVELLAEAARTRLERLHDTEGAIKLLVEASAVSGAAEHEQLGSRAASPRSTRRPTGPRERLGVLERQAHLEANDVARARDPQRGREARRVARRHRPRAVAVGAPHRQRSERPLRRSTRGSASSRASSAGTTSSPRSRAARARSPTPNQKRADLVRVALVHHQQRTEPRRRDRERGSASSPITRTTRKASPRSPTCSRRPAAGARWPTCSRVPRAARPRAPSARLVRLGDALREHLERPVARARRVPQRDRDRSDEQGSTRRSDRAARRRRRRAASRPMRSRRRSAHNGDLGGVLDLLPARLAEAQDDRTKLALLREAAQLRLEHKHDAAGALADLARAFPLAPRDQLIENQLISLAKSTGDYRAPRIAYREAIDALGDDAREAARLRLAYADIVADRLDDPAGAAEAYAPGRGRRARQPPRGPRVRHARRAARPLERCRRRGRPLLRRARGVRRRAARRSSRWPRPSARRARRARDGAGHRARQAQAAGRGRRAVPSPPRGRSIAITAATARRDRGRCAARSSSAANATRGSPTSSRSSASKARRPSCSSACAGSPMPMAAISTALVGAADVATKLGEREQALADPVGRARPRDRGVARHRRRSARRARSMPSRSGRSTALVDLYRTGGRARAAVDTLIEAARLPFDQSTRRDMRLRAAQLATVELGDNARRDRHVPQRARVDAERPRSDRAPRAPARARGPRPRAAHAPPDPARPRDRSDRKLELRLELARLVGIVEERGGRLDALRANLEDRPGHEASIDAVAAPARAARASTARSPTCSRARRSASRPRARPQRAAKLWARYAQRRRDRHQGDRARDRGHRRVVALAADAATRCARSRA